MKRKYSPNVENRQKTSGIDSNQYLAPETVEEAVNILSNKEDITIIAGGTDIMVENHENLYEVDSWLDLEKIKKLHKIDRKNDRIEIGAAVSCNQLDESEMIKKELAALREAAHDVGSPQIRNKGTIGGNIVTSSPAGDMLPVLLVYEAEFELVSVDGRRTVAAKDFFTGPKKNILENDEILTKVIIKLPKENSFARWIKIGKRNALVISSLSLAVRITLDNDCEIIEDVSFAMGAVAPTPLEIGSVSSLLEGKKFSEIDYEEIAQLVKDEISPIDDIRGTAEYRSNVAYNIVIRALEDIDSELEGC